MIEAIVSKFQSFRNRLFRLFCSRADATMDLIVPGQQPITVGHEYSVVVHIPDEPADRNCHWVIPLSVKRVASRESGPQVGLFQFWLMIAGQRRREITSRQAFQAYCCRYDIEHFFRFGKQRLCLTSSQTCETSHEENWLWISMLAYTMLYHASSQAKETRRPWERKKVTVVRSKQTPTMVQRDYERIIRGIGTPASIPKPRGKSPGRGEGGNGKRRKDQPLIRKAVGVEENLKKRRPKKRNANPQVARRRMKRIWRTLRRVSTKP